MPVAKSYDYVLAVWLRLGYSRTPPELLVELREYLETEYQVIKIEIVEESENEEDELTVSMQLQLNFNESQMDGEDPTDEAIGEFDGELKTFLEAKYQVNSQEILDDALTSYLLAEWEEPERT